MLQGQKLQQAYDDYIVNYSAEANLASKTVQNKKYTLGKLIIFLHDQPFTLQTCREFLVYMYAHGWNMPNSKLDLVHTLRAFVNFLYKYKYIKESFAQELVKPKIPQRDFEYVDPETVEKIIIAGTVPGKQDNSRNKTIKVEMRAALRFILRTGLRINELVTLKGKDLNLYDNPPTFWVFSKGGNREILPLPKDMLEELKARQNNGRVFKVTSKTCNEVLQRGAKALELPVKLTNHSLRHIFASNLVKNKVPVQMVSRLMRHSSVEITDKTYTHLDINDLSLILNSNQSIVLKGLTPEQIFTNIERAVRNTGIEKDHRFSLQVEKNNVLLQVIIILK